MDHADDVVFTSPLAAQFLDDSDGVIRGKAALRAYWAERLRRIPDRHFEVVGVYVGVNALAINYRNQLGRLVNEVLIFDGPLVAQGHGTYLGSDANPAGMTSRYRSASLVRAVRHSWLMGDVYLGRLDALEQIWQVWAQFGDDLAEEQWSTATRCPGWDVAAVYAHYSVFPLFMSTVPPLPDGPVGEPVTAIEILRRFNAPDGAAHTMAETVADGAVSEAAAHTRRELVDRFSVHGPRALQWLRQAKATAVVPWPLSGAVITLVEALRIVLMEATVHLLDIQRALEHPPVVPTPALQDTVQLLAELAPAVELIEAATGRSTHSPLPVLR